MNLSDLLNDIEHPVAAFAGDWHGNTHYALHAITYAAARANVIIHVGDYAYLFDSAYLQAQESLLNALGLHLLFVEGNHDNPHYLTGVAAHADGTKRLTPHIWYLPRATRWEWGGISFLGLGGAVSVDRYFRTEGQSWWPEETINEYEMVAAIEGGPVDVMITHDAPLTRTIDALDGTGWAPQLLAESREHRARVEEVCQQVTPRLLVHGHYHLRYTEYIPVGVAAEPCAVEGLDCDGAELFDNIIFRAIDNLKSSGN